MSISNWSAGQWRPLRRSTKHPVQHAPAKMPFGYFTTGAPSPPAATADRNGSMHSAKKPASRFPYISRQTVSLSLPAALLAAK